MHSKVYNVPSSTQHWSLLEHVQLKCVLIDRQSRNEECSSAPSMFVCNGDLRDFAHKRVSYEFVTWKHIEDATE